jgi:hypothetical protein
MKELKERFAGRDFLKWMSLKEGILALDQGKQYVVEGVEWLEDELATVRPTRT